MCTSHVFQPSCMYLTCTSPVPVWADLCSPIRFSGLWWWHWGIPSACPPQSRFWGQRSYCMPKGQTEGGRRPQLGVSEKHRSAGMRCTWQAIDKPEKSTSRIWAMNIHPYIGLPGRQKNLIIISFILLPCWLSYLVREPSYLEREPSYREREPSYLEEIPFIPGGDTISQGGMLHRMTGRPWGTLWACLRWTAWSQKRPQGALRTYRQAQTLALHMLGSIPSGWGTCSYYASEEKARKWMLHK